nr:hypothetical protein [Acidobacteriota bacterium]
MDQATKVDKVGNVLLATYRPDVVERSGRKLKMEYVGMGCVFAFIWIVSFSGTAHWVQSAIATGGTFFLFLGLKKKTRDHLVTSFLMFAAAALAQPAVTELLWVLPYMLFGMCAWAMEGYLEKRRNRIFTLPAVLGLMAWATPLWPLGFAFVAAYLLERRDDVPALRRKLAVVVGTSGLAGAAATAFAPWRVDAVPWMPVRLDDWHYLLLAALAVPVLLCLVFYWRDLAWPHRVNGLLFAAIAPVGIRGLAIFGIAGTIVLAATVFRQSADSLRWRSAFKHAEWY